MCPLEPFYTKAKSYLLGPFKAIVDWENFVIKKVTWDKSSACFNFVKTKSIVCTSTKELC